MPYRLFLVVLASAIVAAGLTIGASLWLFPDSAWTGPATMAVVAGLALVWHLMVNRK